MLQGCSKRRPDVYFELLKHCIIVEIDENQHKASTKTEAYKDICECAQLSEIVGWKICRIYTI
jgi:very-short-patch-repair endonuclease